MNKRTVPHLWISFGQRFQNGVGILLVDPANKSMQFYQFFFLIETDDDVYQEFQNSTAK